MKKRNILPIVVMYLLFFMIAFVTNLCNPMAVIVKSTFSMSNFAAQLGNAANFIAYAVMGIPAGVLLKKMGYRKTNAWQKADKKQKALENFHQRMQRDRKSVV